MLEAYGGLTHMTGDADGPPLLSSVPIGDYMGAFAGVHGALAALYSLFAPWYSDQRLQDAYSAAGRADSVGTVDAARDAHRLDPLALEPIQLLAAALESAHATTDAKRYYLLATKREPQNPDTWYGLGSFYFRQKEWRPAYDALNHSYTLNAFGPAGATGGFLDQARCKVFPTSGQCPVTAPGASP